jgi:metal-responsive CopG/Arc/MetJ family transcriptional regulator
MKIAISVPDATVAKVEALARRWGTSRSAAFARIADAFDEEAEHAALTDIANRFSDAMTEDMRDEQAMWTLAGARTASKHTEW